MQSSTKFTATGAASPNPAMETADWYKGQRTDHRHRRSPGNKVYDFDPFYDMNFQRLNDPNSIRLWFRRDSLFAPPKKTKTLCCDCTASTTRPTSGSTCC